ncbi:MAG: YdeI/OmpD-associated family protein [Renibacterium sp.]|nr:YdeI/OmpD-associated family protein [Renibacterium sp.]
MPVDLPELLLKDAVEWRAWLAEHHADRPGVWLALHKKGGSATELDYATALEHALCFGWIDGQVKRRDAESFFQRWTPRTKKSIWSVKNTEHIADLEARGLMQPAGRLAVQAAKDDGRWAQAYQRQSDAELPPDLLAAVALVPEAQQMLDVLNTQNRFALYFRLSQLKTDLGRKRRIEAFVQMLARHEAPYPQKQKPEA